MDNREQNVKKIVKNYSEFLKPIVGDAELHDRLIIGLDKLLNSNETSILDDHEEKFNLDKIIDFDIFPEAGQTRISNQLRFAKIMTYGQLRDHVISHPTSSGIRQIGEQTYSTIKEVLKKNKII